MSRISVTEVARRFSDIINRVAFRNERFVLVRGGKPVAEIRPLPPRLALSDLPAIFQGLPRLSDEEGAAFARDVDEARRVVRPPLDPWM